MSYVRLLVIYVVYVKCTEHKILIQTTVTFIIYIDAFTVIENLSWPSFTVGNILIFVQK
jgi:hypothetical protein